MGKSTLFRPHVDDRDSEIGNYDDDDRPGDYKVDMPETSFLARPKESDLGRVTSFRGFQPNGDLKKVPVWSGSCENQKLTCVGSLWGKK